MQRDSDRLAVWDAKARSLVARIDAALGEVREPADEAADPHDLHQPELDALTRRVMLRTPPPAGRIIKADTPNMGPQPDRVDHWDAYVCRFDDADDSGPPTF